MKTTEQLEHEFWQLRLENEQKFNRYQDMLLSIERRFNGKLFNVTAGAIALITVLGVIVGITK